MSADIDPWSLDAIVSEAEEVAFKEQQEAEQRAKNEAADKKKAEEQAARQAKAKMQAEEEAKIKAEIDALTAQEERLYDVQNRLQDAKGSERKELKAELIKVDKVCKKLRGDLSKEARKRYAQQAVPPPEVGDVDDASKDAEMEEAMEAEMAAEKARIAKEKREAEEKATYEAIKRKQKEEQEKRLKEEQERAERQNQKGQFSLLDEEDPNRPQTKDSEYTEADIVDDYLSSALRLEKTGPPTRIEEEPEDEFANDPEMQTLRNYVKRKDAAEAKGETFGHFGQMRKPKKEPEKEPVTFCEKFLACYCCKCCKKPAQRLVKWKPFNHFILVLILLNCVFLALAEPDKDDDEGRNLICGYADMLFTVLFTFEMVIKWTANGLSKYFNDGWNILDFVCVMVGLMGFVPGAALGNFSGLRSVRALRPLRTLNAVPGIRMLVSTIFNASVLLRDVLLLIFFLLFLFSIIALQFFVGKLRSVCMSEETGSAWQGSNQLPQTCGDCETGYKCQETVVNPGYGYLNFDNAGSSMLSIFVVMSQDGWVDMMYKIMDVTADFSFLYFILIILFLCIISLNLIAAILASRFSLLRMDHEQELEMERQLAMQEADDEKPDLQDAILRAKDLVASQDGEVVIDNRNCCSKLRGCMHRIVTQTWFVNMSGILILLYCLMLCLKHADQSDLFDNILKFGDMGFSVVFLVELILKLIGYEWKEYFSSGFIYLMQ